MKTFRGWPRYLPAALLCAMAATPVLAQCPNGTPPPCGHAASAVPIDQRKWIVLPFENLGHARDVDWLHDASVNLLFNDLSQWQDVRVVDDERVADYMRATPQARGPARLSLEGARAVARRAGAGNLVMGDFLALGQGMNITAKVYRTTDCRRVRTVQEQMARPDSAMATFARLARRILNVGAPTGTGGNAAAIGTSSVVAYQEYLAGVKALNRFEGADARQHFEQALRIDSSFALAHYKLSVVGTIDSGSAPLRVMHAEAAARLSGSLPARARTLINGNVLLVRHDFGGACERYTTLVREDSSDVEALFGLGSCLYGDHLVEPANANATAWRFRSSWNRALDAFARVLRIDPSYHLAFAPILNMLSTDSRNGCLRDDAAQVCRTDKFEFLAAIRRDADSLLTVPSPPGRLVDYWTELGASSRGREHERNLEQALRIARDWETAGPEEPRPHIALATTLVLLGRFDEAEAEVKRAGVGLPRAERLMSVALQYEIAVKRDRAPEALRLLDTMMVRGTTAASLDVATLAGVAGRLAFYDSILASTYPPPAQPMMKQFPRMVLGMAKGDDVVAAERSLMGAMKMLPPSVAEQLAGMLPMAMSLALRLPHEWPPFMLMTGDPRASPIVAVARHDTAAIRDVALSFDTASFLGAGAAALVKPAIAADLFLIVGDSAAALQRTRRALDDMMPPVSFREAFGSIGLLWPRMMLLRADLATALGFRDEARTWYRRFIELWATADAEFQPIVTRARGAYERLNH